MNRLKEFREKKEMTQQELSEKSKISRYLISKIENDEEINITKNTMIALCNALDCKVTDIFLF